MKLTVNARFLSQRVTGVQRYAREMTRRLPAVEGVESVLGVAPRNAEDAVAMPLTRGGRLKGHAWEQLELPRLVPRDSDVLWSPCNVGPVAVRRQVVTLHDVFSITRPGWVSRPFRAWYGVLLPALTRSARKIITVSEWSRGEIAEALGIDPDKIVVVPEGVDERFSVPSEEARRAVRERLDLPDAFILTVGSLEPRKNLERVVRAWAALPPNERLPLLIAGGLGDRRIFGDYDTDRLLAEPDVRLLGYVSDEDLPALFGSATLMVYAALEEGFGLPPVEALATGAEVVTSDTSAMAENCRDFARLVDPLSEESIRNGIARALASPASVEDRLARSEAVRRRFDWDEAAARTAAILANAAS